MNAYTAQARLFKILMHPTRLAILEILRDGEQCVCHLETVLHSRQAYISQQLTVLREAGLVRDRRDGWNIYYQVTDARVFPVLDAARKLTGAKRPKLPPPTVCPCPKCEPEEAGA